MFNAADESKRPVRLDLNTKLCLMTAIIFSLSDTPVARAVEDAIQLEQLVTKRVGELKAAHAARPKAHTA